MYFSSEELERVDKVLEELDLTGDDSVILSRANRNNEVISDAKLIDFQSSHAGDVFSLKRKHPYSTSLPTSISSR